MNIADLEYRVRHNLPLTKEQIRYLHRHRQSIRDQQDDVDFVTPILAASISSLLDTSSSYDSSFSSSYDSGSSSDSSSFGGGDSGGGGASSDW
jgi:uncharacterized membrane protein YgcG